MAINQVQFQKGMSLADFLHLRHERAMRASAVSGALTPRVPLPEVLRRSALRVLPGGAQY
jgi:hypothetical protein